jgi:hypothetical protein
LCDYLYDDLRPRILHEPRITALCEVCTVLQALMVLDVTAILDMPASGEEEDELDIQFDSARSKKGLNRLHISHLLQMVLQDAQTRLFFKAQAMIQSDIRQFTPKPEDLKYPDILRGMVLLCSRLDHDLCASQLQTRGSLCLPLDCKRRRSLVRCFSSRLSTNRIRGTQPCRKQFGFFPNFTISSRYNSHPTASATVI